MLILLTLHRAEQPRPRVEPTEAETFVHPPPSLHLLCGDWLFEEQPGKEYLKI